MTGSLAPDAIIAGRHTLMNKQSSVEVRDIGAGPGGNAACAQSAPNVLASRSPAHEDAGCGGRQRLAPTGAAA